MQENYTNTLRHLNAMPLSVALLAGEAGKAKMGAVFGRGTSLSLSLSLSRCLRFWHTKIFKRFVYALLRPFCHFEPLQKGEKSTHLPFLDTSLTLKMTRVCRHREQKKR